MARRSGPDRPAFVDGVTRVAALVVFAIAVYVVGYRPASRSDSYFDVNAQLTNTIRAANDGHPFAAYSQRDPSRVVRIDQFASGYYDPGLPALISATSIVGRAVLGPSFAVERRTIYQVVFALCLAAGVVLICPALPLPVSLGALAALGASILIPVDGQHGFNWPRWWEAYSAVLVGMLIVGLLTARRSRWRPLYFAGLTILAAYSRLLREEVVVTTYAAMGALLVTMLTLWIAARWTMRSPPAAAAIGRTLRPAVLIGAVFCAGLAAVPALLRGAIAAAWGIPFAATTSAVHGSGHSLYLSLGHVDNPYAISWRDNVAMAHSHLIDPTVRVEDPRYQDVLQREALRIMVESPWLVRANLSRNAGQIVTFLGSSGLLSAIAVLAALAIAWILAALAWSRRPGLLALCGGLLGLGAGATAPAILIHPHYSFGTQAVVMLLAFVAPWAVLAIIREDTAPASTDPASDGIRDAGRATTWATLCLGLAALIVATAAGGWYAIRASRYAAERAAVADSHQPLADLQRDGYRYARYFNDLPVGAQERLIAAMSATTDPRVAVPDPATAAGGLRPVLVVYTDRQLHVIAWLGKDQPLAAMTVGSAFAFVSACLDCARVREDLPNDPYALDDAHIRLDIAAINNFAWADRYQLLSLPVATATPPTGEVLLALQHIVSSDPTTFAFALQTDGTWRARFR